MGGSIGLCVAAITPIASRYSSAFFDSLGLACEPGAEETPAFINTNAKQAVGALLQTWPQTKHRG